MKNNTKRATVYLDAYLHHALRIKAAETDMSISQLVNESVKFSLKEDSIDLAAFDDRKKESLFEFKDVLKNLKRDGKI